MANNGDDQLVHDIDMIFSRQGPWGRANYFTESARYANEYAHTNHIGTVAERELLLLKVSLGRTNDS